MVSHLISCSLVFWHALIIFFKTFIVQSNIINSPVSTTTDLPWVPEGFFGVIQARKHVTQQHSHNAEPQWKPLWQQQKIIFCISVHRISLLHKRKWKINHPSEDEILYTEWWWKLHHLNYYSGNNCWGKRACYSNWKDDNVCGGNVSKVHSVLCVWFIWNKQGQQMRVLWHHDMKLWWSDDNPFVLSLLTLYTRF